MDFFDQHLQKSNAIGERTGKPVLSPIALDFTNTDQKSPLMNLMHAAQIGFP
jgi:hypothetical protein